MSFSIIEYNFNFIIIIKTLLESLVLEAEDKRVKDGVDEVQGSGDLKEPRLDPLYANKAHNNDEEQNVGGPDAQDEGDEKQSQCTQHVHASFLEHSRRLLQVTLIIVIRLPYFINYYIDTTWRRLNNKLSSCIITAPSTIVEINIIQSYSTCIATRNKHSFKRKAH